MIKRITGKWVLLLLLLVSVLIYVVCTEYPNPFLDQSLSKATAESKSFQNGDTVLIFSSETISVVTYLREYIKEVSVHIDSNRFWRSPDTVFHEEDLTTEPIIIPISFYDTGWNKIIISTTFKNNETKTEVDSLFAYSPLFQYAIVAVPGDSIHLKTNSVMDRDLFYVWDFQDGTPEINYNYPKFDFVLKNAFSKPQGKLYVKDFNNYQSPPVLFSTIAGSEKKLSITSANDLIRGDTIYTGEPKFTFKVYINGPFKSALVNGLLFDNSQTISTGSQISKTFNNLDTLLEPMKASVVVIDKNNESIEKTFYIKYDANQPNLPTILITSPNVIRDTANVLNSVLLMKGKVTGHEANENLYVNFSLNGFDKGYTSLQAENNEWTWTYTLNLIHGWNKLKVYLSKDSTSGSSALVSKEIQIKYDSTKFDSQPPRIIDIKVDGVAISKDEIFTSNNATCELTFDVSDDDAIKAVTVNNDAVQAQPDGLTYKVSIQPVHQIGGQSYIIIATDNNNNTKTDSVTVLLNHAPEIDFVSLPTSMEINSTYNFIVKASDGDVGDKLEKTIKVMRPGGDSIITLISDTVFWKPLVADTGENAIFVYVRDDFFDSDETTMVSKVYQKTDKPLKVSWLTTAADFPSSIIAGKETLSKKLMLDSGTGTAPYSFTVTMENPFKVIYEGSDAQFTWSPKRSDAGVQTLHFIVKDANAESDTLDVLMTITAHPAAEVSFVNQTMTVNENSTNDVALFRLSEPLKDSVIIPYSIKVGTTSSSDLDMQSSGKVVFIPGDTLAELPIKLINDSIPEPDKKFTIALSDLPPLSDKDSIALNKSKSTIEVTIHDDDKRMVKYSFVGSAASGPENTADVFIVVTLDTVLDRDLTMTYYLDKTLSTVNDSDFAFANTNKTLSFKAGDTVDTFKIIITNDTKVEPDKVLVLKLQTDDPYLIPGTNASYQYTIIDDDGISKVQVMFQPPTLRVKEGAQPSAPLVYLSTPLPNDITVTIKATEISSAKFGFYNDYMIPGNKVELKANTQSQPIGLWVIKDNNVEQEEFVEFEIIAISDTVHAEISPSLKSSKVFITDQ